jgi:multicomponent Na+:H+ antiporter subunit E
MSGSDHTTGADAGAPEGRGTGPQDRGSEGRAAKEHAGAPEGRRADRAGVGRRLPTLVGLVLMWIALWGTLSVANLLTGALVALAVLLFAGQIQPRPLQHFDARAAWRYLQTFAKQLLVANWQVIKAVLRPGKIRPGILAMPLYHASDAVVTLVANSITLTPGTLTLDTDRRNDVAILYVHALDLTDADGVREDICELEVLAVDAFAGADAQAVQARTLEELERGDSPPSNGGSAEDRSASDVGASDDAVVGDARADVAVADVAVADDAVADDAVADDAVTDDGASDQGADGEDDTR